MHIRVVNPNTSSAMTATIESSARTVVGPGTRLDAVTSATGPASIESHYDEALSVPGLLEQIAAGERCGVDGYVIACFGDPGLDAARELARGPVLGIAEGAFRAAQFLGRSFSVVTTLARTRGRAWDLVARYGATGACRGVHACEIPVLDLEKDPAAFDAIVRVSRAALEADGSDVIVLGCAGMAEMCAAVSAEVGVPVVDGVVAATAFVEALVTMGLRTSTRQEFAAPPPKAYAGTLRDFALSPSAVLNASRSSST